MEHVIKGILRGAMGTLTGGIYFSLLLLGLLGAAWCIMSCFIILAYFVDGSNPTPVAYAIPGVVISVVVSLRIFYLKGRK